MKKSNKTSMQIIADHFDGYEVKAINFCRRMSNYLTPRPRPKLIANVLTQFPHLKDNPEKFAEKMSQKYQHLSFHTPTPKAQPQETSSISQKVVLEVAQYMKSRNEDPVKNARQLLLDIDSTTSYLKRVKEKQIIRAFRYASEMGRGKPGSLLSRSFAGSFWISRRSGLCSRYHDSNGRKAQIVKV